MVVVVVVEVVVHIPIPMALFMSPRMMRFARFLAAKSAYETSNDGYNKYDSEDYENHPE